MSVAGWRIVLLLVFAALFYGSLAKADTGRVSIASIVEGDADAFDLDAYRDQGLSYACGEQYSDQLTALCKKAAILCDQYKRLNFSKPNQAAKIRDQIKAMTKGSQTTSWSVVDHCGN